MTNTTDKLIIQSETQGVQQTTEQLNQLGKSMDGVSVAAQTVEKSTGSVDSKFASLERRFSTTAGQAAQLEKVQRTVNAAVAQNPELQDRANAVLEAAATRYGAAAVAEKALTAEHVALSTQSQALFHALRGSFEQIALGVSPTQALTAQLNHLTFAASGNGGLSGAFSGVATMASRLVTSLVTPTTAILGLGAAALYLANSWSESGAQVQRALIGIGAASGATVADINAFVKANSSATGLTVGEAQDAAIAFTKTGNIAVQGLKGVGDAIHGYAILTGQDATKATHALAEAFSGDLVKGAEKIDQTYGALNSTTLEYIRTLELQGDRSKAIQVILDAIAPANREAANSVGILTKAYQALAGAMSSIKNGPSLSAASPQDQLAALQAQRNAVAQSGSTIGRNANNELVQFASNSELLANFDRQIDELQKKVDSFNTAHVTTQLNKMSKAGDDVVRSIIPQIDQIHQLEQALATLQAARNTPGVERSLGADDAAVTAIQNQITALKEAQAEAERYNAYIADLSTTWGGVSQSSAIAIQQLQNQLPVAQAVTAADQMRAQELATITNLLLQGKSLYDASAIAAKQLEVAQAAATASVLKQVEALKDSTKMIKAQQDGTEAQTAAAIAYKNAIESGADETAAAALKSATLQNYMARAASDTANIAINLASAVDSLDDPAWYNRPATGFLNPNTPTEMTSGGSYGTDPNNPLFINYKYQGRGKNLDTGTGPAVFASTGGENPSINDILARTAANAYTSGGIDASISAVMTRAQSLSGETNISAVVNQLGQLYDFKNSQTGSNQAKISNLQSEVAWLNTLPDTIARDQKIADLTQSINQLRNSTDGLNSTNQELLSPYYTQDPRTSHIGFRSQGMATGGYVDVPGAPSANDNMLAIIPVASGERISVDPMPSKRGIGGQTIVQITNHIVVGPGAKKDEVGRTVYQSTQNAVRQLKAVS